MGGRCGTGATDDCARLCAFVYRNLDRITDITCTLDSHQPLQIFMPGFWEDSHGGPVGAHRLVSAEDLHRGELRPTDQAVAELADGNRQWLDKQVLDYCEQLASAGRYELYIWPPHCLVGGDGHALLGVVQEARLFHAAARGSGVPIAIKGLHPLTENYSVFAPEVLTGHDGSELGVRDVALLEKLLGGNDVLVVAGEAGSHCVRSSVEDLIVGKEQLGSSCRIYILRDCVSAVAVPDPACDGAFLQDFTAEMEDALSTFVERGAFLVDSTTPIEDWPR